MGTLKKYWAAIALGGGITVALTGVGYTVWSYSLINIQLPGSHSYGEQNTGVNIAIAPQLEDDPAILKALDENLEKIRDIERK